MSLVAPLGGGPRIVLGSFSDESVGVVSEGLNRASHSGTATGWPAAEEAIFVPFELNRRILVKRLWANIGGVASGNLDLGIYTEAGARLVSAGSTAMGTASTLQVIDTTDVLLSRGRYLFACVVDNGTGRIVVASYTQAIDHRYAGHLKMASAFPLPATATFALTDRAISPLVGLSGVDTL